MQGEPRPLTGFFRDPVLIYEAVRELARIDRRPGDTPRTAENRVRNRIRYALERTKALELVNDPAGPAISRKSLCAWVVKKWGAGAKDRVEGFVHDVRFEVRPIELHLSGAVAAMMVWQPDSLDWLRENYPKAEAARQRLEHENSELRRQVITLVAENEALRDKLKLRRDRASEYGKKGGRGRSR